MNLTKHQTHSIDFFLKVHTEPDCPASLGHQDHRPDPIIVGLANYNHIKHCLKFLPKYIYFSDNCYLPLCMTTPEGFSVACLVNFV